jgi:hypothetical protein
MNHLIHPHDVTRRVTRLGEPIASTYKPIKGGFTDTTTFAPLQSSDVWVGTTEIFARFDEGGNSIHTYYNGTIFYIVKQLVGHPAEYVCLPFIVFANSVYTVVTTLNADWTCQLTVNGTAAQAGLGIELLTFPDFSGTTGWVLGTGWSISAGKCIATALGSVQQAYQQFAASNFKRVNRVLCVVDSISGSMDLLNGSVYSPNPIISAGTYIFDALAINVYTGMRGSAGLTCSVDSLSMKEIYNSTTTQAPTYRGYLGG